MFEDKLVAMNSDSYPTDENKLNHSLKLHSIVNSFYIIPARTYGRWEDFGGKIIQVPQQRQDVAWKLAKALTKRSIRCLNRMHVMDEDCSNKPSALEDLPKTNGSPKTNTIKMAPIDGDSDSGKENGTASSNERVPVTLKGSADEDQTPGIPLEKAESEQSSHGEEKKDGNTNEKITELPETPNKITVGEKQKKNALDEEIVDTNSPAFCSGEEEKLPQENATCSDGGIEQEGKGDDNCSLPPSPVEDEDNSGASSPISHGGESKRSEGLRKRGSSDSDSDTPIIVKKMKMTNDEYEERERTVSEYVESAAGTSLEELQRHTEKLQQEIQALGTLARAKEHEWNNIIRIKKVKEEMYLRLQRKKQVMLLMMGSTAKLGDTLDWDLSSDMRYGECSITEEAPAPKSKVIETGFNNTSKATANKSNAKTLNNISQFLLQQQQQHHQPSMLKNSQNQLPLMMVPIVSSSPGNLPSSLSITSTSVPSQLGGGSTSLTRVPETNSKDKLSARSHRPILPKPTIVIPSGSAGNSNNGQNPVIGEGRQGPILDVRSIIADYRSKHPGDVPRRGRRLKSSLSPTPNSHVTENLVSSTRVSGAGGILSMASLALGSGSQMRPGLVGSNAAEMPDLGFLLSAVGDAVRQDSSRPSSADSSRSGAPSHTVTDTGNVGSVGGISFKDVLVQFAKLSQNEQRHEAPPPVAPTSKPPPYPEVTLHPVLAPHSPPQTSPSSSLLHGILTKSTSMQQHRADSASARATTFSPTLARLLTAPERMPSSVANTTVTPFHGSTGPVSINDLLSTSKTRNEITITPVAAQQPVKAKQEVELLEEEQEQEDSADRLVIDESGEGEARGRGDGDDDPGSAQEMSADDVPQCQGCHQRAAQFVCAGCGNQWYCSRDCQVSAWDEHSEVCSG